MRDRPDARPARSRGLTTVKLLEGVRVLDLTNVLAGPFCCYQLAQPIRRQKHGRPLP